MTPGGWSFRKPPEIEPGFQVPLISNEAGGIFYVPLAQLGEHSTFNRGAMGSSPIWNSAAQGIALPVIDDPAAREQDSLV